MTTRSHTQICDPGLFRLVLGVVKLSVRDARRGDAEALAFLWEVVPTVAERGGLPAIEPNRGETNGRTEVLSQQMAGGG